MPRLRQDQLRERTRQGRHQEQHEQQIEKVLLNISNMYVSIRRNAGSQIPAVRHLELPGVEEDVEEADEDCAVIKCIIHDLIPTGSNRSG